MQRQSKKEEGRKDIDIDHCFQVECDDAERDATLDSAGKEDEQRRHRDNSS